MTTPSATAIYARISSDPEGKALGVERQEEDRRFEAERLGWTVAEVYVDNDVSAFSKKPRPEFERMLEDLRSGARDSVVCYHIDRLTRRNRDLDRFLEAVDEGKVRKVRFVSGSTDLGSGDGLLVARIMAAVAENESATKSRRIKSRRPSNVVQPFSSRHSMYSLSHQCSHAAHTRSPHCLSPTSLRCVVWCRCGTLGGPVCRQGVATMSR